MITDSYEGFIVQTVADRLNLTLVRPNVVLPVEFRWHHGDGSIDDCFIRNVSYADNYSKVIDSDGFGRIHDYFLFMRVWEFKLIFVVIGPGDILEFDFGGFELSDPSFDVLDPVFMDRVVEFHSRF